jgi:hypothetical protein
MFRNPLLFLVAGLDLNQRPLGYEGNGGCDGRQSLPTGPKGLENCRARGWSGLGLVGRHSRTKHGQLTRGRPATPSPSGKINLGSAGRGFGEGQPAPCWSSRSACFDSSSRGSRQALAPHTLRDHYPIFTSMVLGLAFSDFGRWTSSTPSLYSATTPLPSASSGIVKLRPKRPYARSTR